MRYNPTPGELLVWYGLPRGRGHCVRGQLWESEKCGTSRACPKCRWKWQAWCSPRQGEPKDGKAGLGSKNAPGRRARGSEKKTCVDRDTYLSALKMTLFWRPGVIAMASGSLLKSGCTGDQSDLGVHPAKSCKSSS